MHRFLVVVLLAAAARGQAPTAYADAVISHLPVGCGFTPTIFMVNPTSQAVSFEVRFYSSDGKPKPVSIGNKAMTSYPEGGGWIAPNGSTEIVLDRSGDNMSTCNGWAEVSSGEVLAGYVKLDQNTRLSGDIKGGGKLVVDVVTQSSVPFASRFANRFLVPFRMKSVDPLTAPAGIVTGIALVNPSPNQAANVTISYRQSSGCLITRETITLPPQNQTAFALDNRTGFTRSGKEKAMVSLADTSGVAEISSDSLELAGFALQFEGPNFVSFPGQSPIARTGASDDTPCPPKN